MGRRGYKPAKSVFSKRQPREKSCVPGFHHEFIDALDPKFEICKHCSLPRKKSHY